MAVYSMIYPRTLPGLAFNVVRRPKGNTAVQEHVSGRETRLGYWTYPLYEWDLTYSLLRDFLPCPGYAIPSELKRLEGFFLAVQGSLLPFAFDDPDDDHVVGQYLGTGDGTTTDFLLTRTWGDTAYIFTSTSASVTEPVGFVEPDGAVLYLNGIPRLYGIDWTITGGPTRYYASFFAPPAASLIVTGDYTYYFWCRFKEDSMDFEKFSGAPGAGWWTVKKLTLVSFRQ